MSSTSSSIAGTQNVERGGPKRSQTKRTRSLLRSTLWITCASGAPILTKTRVLSISLQNPGLRREKAGTIWRFRRRSAARLTSTSTLLPKPSTTSPGHGARGVLAEPLDPPSHPALHLRRRVGSRGGASRVRNEAAPAVRAAPAAPAVSPRCRRVGVRLGAEGWGKAAPRWGSRKGQGTGQAESRAGVDATSEIVHGPCLVGIR